MEQSPFGRPFQTEGSGQRYKDKRYGSFLQRQVARREHRIAEKLLISLGLSSGEHIVDLPCGYGRFLPLLKAHGLRVSAMDQSQSMVDICREHAVFDPDRDQAMAADVLQPLPEAANGAVAGFCIRLFQHLHNPRARVLALRTLGANRRRLVLTYYDRGCMHYWTKRALMALKRKPVRIKMIARSEFEAEVAEAGLRVVRRVKLIPGIHAQTWVTLAPAD